MKSYVDCPFSLCVSQADLIDRVLGDRTTGGFRRAFRRLAFPLAGSVKQSVTVRSRMRLDLSEPGRFHAPMRQRPVESLAKASGSA